MRIAQTQNPIPKDPRMLCSSLVFPVHYLDAFGPTNGRYAGAPASNHVYLKILMISEYRGLRFQLFYSLPNNVKNIVFFKKV